LTWAITGAVLLGLIAGGLILARREDIVRWNTERRLAERRKWERREGNDRRGELRLDHDERVNNANRRKSDRREGERRQDADWKEQLENVRERVEDIQHNNLNR
jgi:hypothetical protein